MQVSVMLLIVSMVISPIYSGKATFQLKLISYNNPTGVKFNDVVCSGVCNTLFFIYIYQGTGRHGFHTQTFDSQNSITFASTGNLGGNFPQPNSIAYTDYSGEVLLSIIVFHNDGSALAALIDTVNSILTTDTPGIQSATDVQGRSTAVNSVTITGAKVTMVVEFSVTCDTYYFGRKCDIHCEPQNDNGGHFTCTVEGQRQCRPGWLNPPTCTTQDYCHTQTCHNNGKCENEATGYICKCPVNYNGTQCEQTLSKCDYDNPCKLGSECRTNDTNVNQTLCDCKPGYTGPFCDQDINECLPNNPCKNKGTCVNMAGSYYCSCTDKYFGQNCKSIHPPCHGISPCLNGGTCTDGNNQSYTCACANGFSGQQCSMKAMVGVEKDPSMIIVAAILGVLCLIFIVVIIVICVRGCRSKQNRKSEFDDLEMSGHDNEMGPGFTAAEISAPYSTSTQPAEDKVTDFENASEDKKPSVSTKPDSAQPAKDQEKRATPAPANAVYDLDSTTNGMMV